MEVHGQAMPEAGKLVVLQYGQTLLNFIFTISNFKSFVSRIFLLAIFKGRKFIPRQFNFMRKNEIHSDIHNVIFGFTGS